MLIHGKVTEIGGCGRRPPERWSGIGVEKWTATETVTASWQRMQWAQRTVEKVWMKSESRSETETPHGVEQQ